MDTPRKLIVGYDLCDDFTQISCYSYKSMEPIPISLREGEEERPIPTVLCLKTETKQWIFGEDAIVCANNGGGLLVDHLLDKLQKEESVNLFGIEYLPITLLEKYLRKTLMLVKNYFPTETITKLVVTVRNADPILVGKIYEALEALGLEKDRAVVMNHAGAYLYYALSQDKALWMNDVGLFDFSEEGLYFYQLSINRRSKPMIAQIAKKEYTDSLSISMVKSKMNNLSYIFENTAAAALYKQLITTLYFTGNGFDGGWADEAMKSLCVGRRAFMGQNLFTKGACYAAKELSGDRNLEEFLLLNDDMITSFVTLRVYSDTTFKELPLIEAGENWYEVDKSIEIIPEGRGELEITIKNIVTRDVKRDTVQVLQFPERPDKMTRLLVHISCKDRLTVLIRIKDLGFGDFYMGSEQEMDYTLDL